MNRSGAFQRGWEFEAWIALCKAFGVRRYVELGWGKGDTAEFAYVNLWADFRTQIVSVDFVPEPVGGRGRFPRQNIHYVSGLSYDPDSLAQATELLGGQPDAVFVDAEHNMGAPQKDFALWWPVTTKLMGFHDIEAFDSGRLWREVSPMIRSLEIYSRDARSQREFVALGNPGSPYAGIGVLFKEE